MSVHAVIESILFVASRPLTVVEIAKVLREKETAVEDAIETLSVKYNREDSGIHLLLLGDRVQLATNPAFEGALSGFIKQEAEGELTRAQLETLTVIAYRGPMTRPELEEIRGVNCAVIVRTLLVRGLIDEQQGENDVFPMYRLSFDALGMLGIQSAHQLPDYEALHAHAHIEAALKEE